MKGGAGMWPGPEGCQETEGTGGTNGVKIAAYCRNRTRKKGVTGTLPVERRTLNKRDPPRGGPAPIHRTQPTGAATGELIIYPTNEKKGKQL